LIQRAATFHRSPAVSVGVRIGGAAESPYRPYISFIIIMERGQGTEQLTKRCFSNKYDFIRQFQKNTKKQLFSKKNVVLAGEFSFEIHKVQRISKKPKKTPKKQELTHSRLLLEQVETLEQNLNPEKIWEFP